MQNGGETRLSDGNYTLNGVGSRLEIGAKTTMFSATSVAQEGRSVVIGEDCMFSSGVDLRSSDGHSILDLTSRERINPAADLIIGEHVWIGVEWDAMS